MTPDGRRRAAVLATLFAAFVVYASLFPFAFRPSPPGAWEAALARGIGGRGDVLANLALYAPLGILLAWAVPGGRAILAALAVAACLSLTVEVAQLFARGRTSSPWDLVMNIAGAFGGALLAALLARLRPTGADGLAADRFAALLLLAWLGSRLHPYVPTLDWQALKDALKPLLLHPEWEPMRAIRLALAWLLAARLAEAALPRPALSVPAIVLAVGLGGEALIATRSLSLAEAVAVPAGLLLWLALRRRVIVGAAAAVALVLLVRLEPFAFSADARPFGWVPFRSLIGGSWAAGLQAMLEKLFLYGGLQWSFARAGARRSTAALGAFALVLATSVAQTHLPGRSAEIGDGVLVLGLALLSRALLSPPRMPRPRMPHPGRGGAGAGPNPPP